MFGDTPASKKSLLTGVFILYGNVFKSEIS